MNWRKLRKTLTIFAIGILAINSAFAEIELDDATIKTWADDLFGRALEMRRFSGLGLVAVQDGKVVSTLTYGYEKWADKVPIDPARTQFRIGSTSKTFTATAVAQLADQGLIVSLDDSANKYLRRVQLPDWDGQQISIWDLLTHRAGFEEIGKSIASDETMGVPVGGEVIENLMPELVRPPGKYSVYCNYCTALLGTLVEDISGQTLHDFLTDNVFRPIGMSNTILAYDHRPTNDVGIAEIFYPNGETAPLMHSGIHPFIAPAGAISTTLDDMGKYMIAHLDAGKASAKPLMSEQMFNTMHTLKTSNHPSVGGFGMKFMVHNWNGEKVVEHAGGWPGYSTSMTLFPNSNAAIFVSIFAANPPLDLWSVLANQVGFENRLTPRDDLELDPPLHTFNLHDMVLSHFLGDFAAGNAVEQIAEKQNLDQYVGWYRGVRRNHTSASRLIYLLLGGSTRVERHPDGGLMVNSLGPYVQISPDTFWMANAVGGEYAPRPGTYLYAFMRNDEGGISHIARAISIDPAAPIAAYEAPENAAKILLVSLLLSMTGLIAIFRAWRGKGSIGINGPVIAIAVTAIGVFASYLDLLGPGRGNNPMFDIDLGRTGELLTVLLFTNIYALLAIPVFVAAVRLWRRSDWEPGLMNQVYRLQVTLIALGAIIAIPFLWMHGGIGFALP